MSKRIYISADYSEENGDRNVVEVLHKWSEDDLHVVDYVDTAQVISGSVSKDPNCRACDLKKEFNDQINASSVVLFVIGDKTATRTAGSLCRRLNDGAGCDCTPYKQNVNGTEICKIKGSTRKMGPDEDVGYINNYSYIEHEFKQSKKKGKIIVIVYNSLNKQSDWLPEYMKAYENQAFPFWTKNANDEKIGDYNRIKQVLGYE